MNRKVVRAAFFTVALVVGTFVTAGIGVTLNNVVVQNHKAE
jgi:hypothetical protein